MRTKQDFAIIAVKRQFDQKLNEKNAELEQMAAELQQLVYIFVSVPIMLLCFTLSDLASN
jgi:hypothetical protein